MAVTSLTDFTDYATIRGVLGVAATELTDTDLALPIYFHEVVEAFAAVNSTVVTMYETVKAIDAGTRTAQQTRYYNIVQVYSAYLVASVLVSGALEMFAPKEITDGKAKTVRVDDPFSNLRSSIALSLAAWRARLQAVLLLLDPTQTFTAPAARTNIAVVPMGVDRVTGA